MTPAEAEVLAARILAAIDTQTRSRPFHNLNRERVASDLAGLRAHFDWNALGICGELHHQPKQMSVSWPCPDAARYADGLRRTAALYGVT